MVNVICVGEHFLTFVILLCCEGKLRVQLNNVKECVLDSVSDLVGKVEKRARKP
jgi:hypothetical protein